MSATNQSGLPDEVQSHIDRKVKLLIGVALQSLNPGNRESFERSHSELYADLLTEGARIALQHTAFEVEGLHPKSIALLRDFSRALAEKMLKSQGKYGWTNEWASSEWEFECRRGMMEHIQKGDPKDVAIYAAFMWFHSWSTATGVEW